MAVAEAEMAVVLFKALEVVEEDNDVVFVVVGVVDVFAFAFMFVFVLV